MSQTQPLPRSTGFRKIKELLPEFLKSPLRRVYLTMSFARPVFIAPHYCPVCQTGLSRFKEVEWKDTRCVFCDSDTRQRLAWSFFWQRTKLFDGKQKRMLHVAPEPQFAERLSKLIGHGYVAADLLNPGVDVRLDITQIPFPEDSFDVIVCSHVLEHVPNDRQAMREFVRVLKPDGWAMIMIPCFPDRGPTFEDFSVTDPAERLRLFMQEDHVRLYGNDFVDRLKESGFKVQVYHASDFMSPSEITRLNITAHSGDVFLCTKQ